MIEDYLRSLGCYIQSIKVKKMRSVDDFEDGLIEILDKVIILIVKKRLEGIKMYVNAIPGYKAEVAFITIASIFAGANAVIYIHDAFKQPVPLPTPPLSINTQITNKINKYSRKLNA